MQEWKNFITSIDVTITVPSISHFIELGQGNKPVTDLARWRNWLRGNIAKQLASIVDRAILISIKY